MNIKPQNWLLALIVVNVIPTILEENYKAIALLTAAGISLGFSLLLTRPIVQPLTEMTTATEKIALGEYDIALQVKSKNELGMLAREITTMSQKLKAFRDLNVGRVIVEKQP